MYTIQFFTWIYLKTIRSITCHMGAHSVTCHPTHINAPRLNLSQTDRYLIYLQRRDERLSWPWRWLYSYVLRWFTCLQTVTLQSSNHLTATLQYTESNPRFFDCESNSLPLPPPSRLSGKNRKLSWRCSIGLCCAFSTLNRSNKVRWSIDLRWQSPHENYGFYDIADGILLRSADQSSRLSDWNKFLSINRKEVWQKRHYSKVYTMIKIRAVKLKPSN